MTIMVSPITFTMFALLTAALLASVSFAFAASSARPLGPRPGQIKNLVTFGDSYTDVVRTSRIWFTRGR